MAQKDTGEQSKKAKSRKESRVRAMESGAHCGQTPLPLGAPRWPRARLGGRAANKGSAWAVGVMSIERGVVSRGRMSTLHAAMDVWRIGIGTGIHWTGREKQEVFPAGPKDGFTPARPASSRSGPSDVRS
jgi:hypothetical protein